MNIIRMRVLGHVFFMGDKKNAYWYLVPNDGHHLEDQGEDARTVLAFILKK
jgi:hypothetical protein